jgi:hypothetical protein
VARKRCQPRLTAKRPLISSSYTPTNPKGSERGCDEPAREPYQETSDGSVTGQSRPAVCRPIFSGRWRCLGGRVQDCGLFEVGCSTVRAVYHDRVPSRSVGLGLGMDTNRAVSSFCAFAAKQYRAAWVLYTAYSLCALTVDGFLLVVVVVLYLFPPASLSCNFFSDRPGPLTFERSTQTKPEPPRGGV